MCGIAGIYFKQAVAPERLNRIGEHFARSLRHRGPDHFGIHQGSRCLFANLRLAIVDKTGGNQPIYTPDKGLGIVYNGEVYNWETLRKPLQANGYPFQTHSDTESILAAYQAYGDEVFKLLNGMFAACIWNEESNSLVLARDRFGSKPLYIYEDETCFAFASEIKTLLGLPNLDLSLNPDAFQDYLTYRYTLAPHSFFKRIERLPAGCLLNFDGQQVNKRFFAHVSIQEPALPKSLSEYQAELDQHLNNAVNRQLMGEVPIGLLLSGGLDSSCLAYYMQGHGVNFKAYSIGFPEINEFEYSRAIAQQFGMDYQEVCISQDQLFAGLDETILRLDEPLADPACFALSHLCRDIKRDVTVVLSGEGGDEMFAGYPYYQSALDATLDKNQSFAQFFYQSSNYFDAGDLLKDKQLSAQQFRYKTTTYDVADSRLNGMQAWDLQTWLPENLMMKADKILMSHSLEGRFPFLDLDLYGFARNLPQAMKYPAANVRKHLLYRLMANKLPESVLKRPKMGFTVPPIFFLQRLQARFFDTLSHLSQHAVADVLDLPAITRLVMDFYAGKPIPVFKVWSIFVMLDWFMRAYPIFTQASVELSWTSAPPTNAPHLTAETRLNKPSENLVTQTIHRKPFVHEHLAFCDGGLANRLNALIFCLTLKAKYGHHWEIAWPRNNWCGAAFHKLFDTDITVHEHSIVHYKQHQTDYRFLFHENQVDFNEDLICYHHTLAGFSDYQQLLDAYPKVLYFNNLIPGFASLDDIRIGLLSLNLATEIKRTALNFCTDQLINEQVLGLHIRKTDFGDCVDDTALFDLVRKTPKRFFVCSDDAEVNHRFALLPNCHVFTKTSFPEKLIVNQQWRSQTQDSEGRSFPFNITRSQTAIAEALVDLLILSRTSLVETSPSTFLKMAWLFKNTGFFSD